MEIIMEAVSDGIQAELFQDRVDAVRSTALPAVSVEASREEVSPEGVLSSVSRQERRLTVLLTAVASSASGRNQLALELEAAVYAASEFLSEVADLLSLSSVEFDSRHDADRTIYAAQLTYQVVYRTIENSPEA